MSLVVSLLYLACSFQALHADVVSNTTFAYHLHQRFAVGISVASVSNFVLKSSGQRSEHLPRSDTQTTFSMIPPRNVNHELIINKTSDDEVRRPLLYTSNRTQPRCSRSGHKCKTKSSEKKTQQGRQRCTYVLLVWCANLTSVCLTSIQVLTEQEATK